MKLNNEEIQKYQKLFEQMNPENIKDFFREIQISDEEIGNFLENNFTGALGKLS